MNSKRSFLDVRVVTGAKKVEVTGYMADGALKIKLQSKPIEGKANSELIEKLADILSIHKANIIISIGEHSKKKLLQITGLDQTEILERLRLSIKN